MEFVIDPEELWKLKDAVVSKTDLISLMGEYGIVPEAHNTGSFTHKTYCPFHRGRGGGQERTPSFFISSTTNSFFCFGCQRTGDVINFVSFIEATPPTEALKKLAIKNGLIGNNGEITIVFGDVQAEPVKTIDPILIEISEIIRNYRKRFIGTDQYDAEFKWTEKACCKIDAYLSTIGFEDWEYVENLREKLKITIKNRLKVKRSITIK